MNALEDAFWSARAAALATRSRGRAAIVVKRGRRLAEAVASGAAAAPVSVAILDAGSAARGATVYVAQAPSRDALEHAARARIRRIVVPPHVAIARELEELASRARVSLANAVPDDGSPAPATGAPVTTHGALVDAARRR